ncbi:DUF917 family protein [Paracoccus sp. (in: a-proteobacteria)]|uniref:S-methyl thiohydantoin desulfurase domain-containing protein n=1 Tax=Paracoccus sp. TaxID=267 RepID=UPI003A8A89D8
MKRELTIDDVEAAVLGGAILGGGGGGFIDAGLDAARLALQFGTPQLWSVDEFNPEDLSVTVALVGAPAAPNPFLQPRHHLRSLELLQRELPQGRRLAAINTNENGAQTTVNGWFHAALSGLPVIDLACNGRAHPSSQMGALGLHAEPDYLSLQGFAGGKPEYYVEGSLAGRLDATSGVVRRASVDAGGLVTVARNPVTVDYARRNGAPGAISAAIALGRAYMQGGMPGAVAHLRGTVMAEGVVTAYRCDQREGLDIGLVELDDGTALHFVNEYMVAEQGGTRHSRFPELIMTFDENGRPLVSAHVRKGQRISVIHAPASSLLLSRTMTMPELYRPLEDAIGRSFAPD